MIKVDKQQFADRKAAISHYSEAVIATDGSECNRMAFAYSALICGYSEIDTYNGTAR